MMRPVFFQTGQRICMEGDKATDIMFLVKGSAVIYKTAAVPGKVSGLNAKFRKKLMNWKNGVKGKAAHGNKVASKSNKLNHHGSSRAVVPVSEKAKGKVIFEAPLSRARFYACLVCPIVSRSLP